MLRGSVAVGCKVVHGTVGRHDSGTPNHSEGVVADSSGWNPLG